MRRENRGAMLAACAIWRDTRSLNTFGCSLCRMLPARDLEERNGAWMSWQRIIGKGEEETSEQELEGVEALEAIILEHRDPVELEVAGRR